MEIKEEVLREQLKYLYQLLEISFKTRVIIKGWCITVLSAVAIAMLKYKELFLEDYMFIIIFFPIFFFWYLEIIEGARTFLYRQQAQKIEERIALNTTNFNNAEDIFIISRYEKLGRWKKIKACFITAFMGETTVSFYFAFYASSNIFLWKIFPYQFLSIFSGIIITTLSILIFILIAYLVENREKN